MAIFCHPLYTSGEIHKGCTAFQRQNKLLEASNPSAGTRNYRPRAVHFLRRCSNRLKARKKTALEKYFLEVAKWPRVLVGIDLSRDMHQDRTCLVDTRNTQSSGGHSVLFALVWNAARTLAAEVVGARIWCTWAGDSTGFSGH